MKLSLFALIIALYFPNTSSITKRVNIIQVDKIEDRILDKVSKLPEFKYLVGELNEHKSKGIHASVMIAVKPTQKNPYYEIWLGFDHPTHFETVYVMRLKSRYTDEPNIVQYLEMSAGNGYIPLLKWRALRKDK